MRDGLYIHTRAYITSNPNASVSYFGKKYLCICYITKYNETVSTNITLFAWADFGVVGSAVS